MKRAERQEKRKLKRVEEGEQAIAEDVEMNEVSDVEEESKVQGKGS